MYTVVANLLLAGRYQQFLREAHQILAPGFRQVGQVEFDQVAREMTALCSEDSERYLASMKAIGKLASLQSIIHQATVEAFLRENCGFKIITMCAQAVLHVSGDSASLKDFDAKVSWHQDWPNTGGSKNSMVVWVPLGGCDAAEGGLILAEGENFPLLDYKNDGKVCAITEAAAFALRGRYVAPNLGSGILFDQFHPHRSQSGPNVRIAVSVRYEDASCMDWRDRGFEYLHQRSQVSREFTEW